MRWATSLLRNSLSRSRPEPELVPGRSEAGPAAPVLAGAAADGPDSRAGAAPVREPLPDEPVPAPPRGAGATPAPPTPRSAEVPPRRSAPADAVLQAPPSTTSAEETSPKGTGETAARRWTST